MPVEINDRAPSISVGENTNLGVSAQRSTRQTFSDTLATRVVGVAGSLMNGASTVGQAMMGAMGSTVGVAAMAKLGQAGQSMTSQSGAPQGPLAGVNRMGGSGMAMTAGTGNGMATGMTSSPGLGNTGAPMTSAGAQLPSGQIGGAGLGTAASGQNTAFGAGASALPGGDLSGGSGMGVGGATSSGSSSTSMGSNTAIGSAAGGTGGQDQLLNATKQMQETQMSFNLQYLQLQSQMQSENRSYTAVSNIMKTKHDTVKNSISNIR